MPKKRKDGRYQRKITLSDGRQKIVYGRTLAELNAAADAVRDEDRQGIKVGDDTLVASGQECGLRNINLICVQIHKWCTKTLIILIYCRYSVICP